ncbi:hypothetical protein [Henriciella pelagia]|uniref:hypothetical protein n=1 Tax=Henriciella pelagia TaxID=1977912 RepID=UPI0035113AD7
MSDRSALEPIELAEACLRLRGMDLERFWDAMSETEARKFTEYVSHLNDSWEFDYE